MPPGTNPERRRGPAQSPPEPRSTCSNRNAGLQACTTASTPAFVICNTDLGQSAASARPQHLPLASDIRIRIPTTHASAAIAKRLAFVGLLLEYQSLRAH